MEDHKHQPPSQSKETSLNNISSSQKSTKENQQILPKNKKINTKKPIWDCGSTLYDSFELNSFQKQLDSAIINSSRTLSMPRLPSETHRAPPPPQPQPQPPPSKKPITSKFSRSFQKLLKSVFKAQKNTNKPNYDISCPEAEAHDYHDPWFLDHDDDNNIQEPEKDKKKVVESGRYFVVFEKPNGLSTIPEVPEVGFSPEIKSLVKKTMSDRFSFTATSDGIYCV